MSAKRSSTSEAHVDLVFCCCVFAQVLEPMSLLQHRLYLAVANLFSRKKASPASAPAS